MNAYDQTLNALAAEKMHECPVADIKSLGWAGSDKVDLAADGRRLRIRPDEGRGARLPENTPAILEACLARSVG